MHGGVRGGVHGIDSQLDGGRRGSDRDSGVTVGGSIIFVLIELSPPPPE